jgi:hypothetical protein
MRPHKKEGHFHFMDRTPTASQEERGLALSQRADTATIRTEASRLWYALKIACVAFKAS